MEFNFKLSELFPGEICIIGNDLVPEGCPAVERLGAKVVKERVSEVLDVIGQASAEAQALNTIITNAEKTRSGGGEQKLYLFCDLQSNTVVGLLKIGKKKLFLFDQQGTQHEMFPVSILDFYIHESRQRQGAGKYLFEFMLRETGTAVEHFAIDRPSDKLLFFLRKHYGLSKLIPQVNNFALFDGFFTSRADYAGKKARWNGLDQTPEKASKAHDTRLEDSLDYNNEPLIHLRNGNNLPSSQQRGRNNATTIGQILQPSGDGGHGQNGHQQNGQMNGNGHGHHGQPHHMMMPEPETKQLNMTVHTAASYSNASKEIQQHRGLHNHSSLW